MKLLKTTILMVLAAITMFACNTQSKEKPQSTAVLSQDVQVYYFHNTKRCATCNAVENETLAALEMFYKDKMEAGTMAFVSLNLEEEKGAEMARALKVSGQTLIIVKGEKQLNLTNDGFMNARTNPVKFHEILKTEIDNLL